MNDSIANVGKFNNSTSIVVTKATNGMGSVDGSCNVRYNAREPSANDEEVVDPDKDMVVVCSNCHRIIHRKR